MGSVMHFRSGYSTNALRRLEQLAELLSTGEPSTQAVHQSMYAMDSLFVSLERQVVGNDGLGIAVACEEELVFRTARMIVDTQLDRLAQAIRYIVAVHPPEPAERWSRFLDVIPLGKTELRRITELWLPYRSVKPEASTPYDFAAYQAAIRVAFSELSKLDEIPEIERMLYRGVASTTWPEIATACEQILVAIRAHADRPSVRRLWVTRSHWARAVAGR